MEVVTEFSYNKHSVVDVGNEHKSSKDVEEVDFIDGKEKGASEGKGQGNEKIIKSFTSLT